MAEQTITERIRSAGKSLGVSKQKLMEQMIGFYKIGDSTGMKQMFEAYKDWEISGRDGKITIEETIALAKENFDCIARVADGYVESGDLMAAMIQTANLPRNTSGQISQFYREAIGYQPFNPNMN